MAPFYLLCPASNLVLDVKDGSREKGTPVVMWEKNGGKNQLWKYKDGMIWSKDNKKLVLDVDSANRRVVVWPAHGGPNQQWTFEPDGTLLNGTGHVLDVADCCTDPGARLIPYAKNGGANQCFKMVPAD